MLSRKRFMIISIILGFSFLAKLAMMDYTLDTDGGLYYRMGQAWSLTGSFLLKDSPYLHNLGFPLLHGVIYEFTQMSYHTHLILTISYSVASLVFAYLFLKSFVNFKYAIIGTMLLAFNYRLIVNSTLGISEPLFLLLVWGALYFSLRNNHSIIFGIILAMASVIVRFEGLAVLAFVIYQCIAKRNIISLIVAFLSLVPFYFTKFFDVRKVEESHYISNHLGLIEVHIRHELKFIISQISDSFVPKMANSMIYFGWSLFPEFLLLLPFGIYAVCKRVVSYSLLVWIVLFGAVGMYAYLDAYDTRYFFLSYLFVDLLCMIGLRHMITSTFKS